MTTDDYSDEEVAIITANIDLAFEFFRAVLDDLSLLDEFPSGVDPLPQWKERRRDSILPHGTRRTARHLTRTGSD